mgnify:CR=1 FL=1
MPKMLPIAKIIRETSHVKTFVFRHQLGAKPGQFINIWVPRVDEKPMSVAMSNDVEFWLTIFAVGGMTKRLHEMKVGDLVGIRGPFGTSFEYESGDHLVLLGGGYGAAPLYFLASEAVKKKCTIDFIVGARGKEHLLFLDRVKKLGKNVKLHIATDDGSVGTKGYNTQILESVLSSVKPGNKKMTRVFAVGPELMMKRASDMCFAHKISCQVSIERYMKCGFGVCGNCCVDDSGERMCMEGPVVDHLRARKMKDFGAYHRDKVGRKITF